MADPKYAHEKHAARDKAKVTPYDLPIPKYCAWPAAAPAKGRCGGELHIVDQLRGEPITDTAGHPTYGTICEKCHHVTVYETGRRPTELATRSTDAKKKARELADELSRTGVLINPDGSKSPLTVLPEGKHWKVRTEKGAFIYAFSTTPSDIRAIRNVEAQLKRLSLRWGDDVKTTTTATVAKDRGPGLDADNLNELQKRAIEIRGRLTTLRVDLGASLRDLCRVGMDAAKKRNAWSFKNEGAAQVQMSRFLRGQGTYGDPRGARSLEFYEAIVEELEGVPPAEFWNPTDLSKESPVRRTVPTPLPPPSPAPPPVVQPTPAPEPPPVLGEASSPPSQSKQLAALVVELEEAELQLKELEEERDELRRANSDLATKNHDMVLKLDQQRAQTLSAEAHVRQLTEERAEMAAQIRMLEKEQPVPLAANGADPLYVKVLKKLVAASDTPEEIAEAFDAAREIAENNL